MKMVGAVLSGASVRTRVGSAELIVFPVETYVVTFYSIRQSAGLKTYLGVLLAILDISSVPSTSRGQYSMRGWW
jgi:hypothetical protein